MSGPDVVALVSLAVAIPGVLETFVHAGQYLSRKLQYEPEASEVIQMQNFVVFLTRGSMRSTLESLEDLYWDTPDESFQQRLQEEVRELWKFILALEQNIDKRKTERDGKKRKKATEDALGQINKIYNLEERMRNFVQTQVAARSIRSKLELRPSQFAFIGELQRLPFTSHNWARVDFRTLTRKGQECCVVEEKKFPTLSAAGAYEAARDIARVLQYNKASQGLLELAGFQVLSKGPIFDDTFRLIFRFPSGGTNPRSLRDILLDPINEPIPPIPRNYRFILPRKLAESVFHVHTNNLVHKSIRPESIIVFDVKPDESQSQLGFPQIIGSPYLIDWQLIRRTGDPSNLNVVNEWTRGLYQHPERQPGLGDIAESRYHIGHDIYSFGVCLLEIGLWKSFLQRDAANNSYTLSPVLATVRADWIARNAVASATMNSAQIDQQVFIQLAGTRLAYEMGEAYSKMVIKCLSCLENGFGNVLMFVGSDSHDWDKQGVLFIQEIRRELANACVMGVGIYNSL